MRSCTRETQSEPPKYRCFPLNTSKNFLLPCPKVTVRKFLNTQRTSSKNLGEPQNCKTKLDLEEKDQEISNKF